jgi:hypothetical protein
VPRGTWTCAQASDTKARPKALSKFEAAALNADETYISIDDVSIGKTDDAQNVFDIAHRDFNQRTLNQRTL